MKVECENCHAVFDEEQIEWEESPTGMYGPANGDPYGKSHNQRCPECGAENSFIEQD